jgi:glycosyltransferase involved in cell wall biosynthesis
MKPEVTVVIPTFNRLWGLKDCISSIQKQTYNNWSVLVVDDAGSDPVEDFIESLNDSRIQYYRQNKNLGVAGNWISGIKKVNTEYFSILMDDDWYGKDFLKNRMSILTESRNIGVVYGPYVRWNCKNLSGLTISPKKKGFINNARLTEAMISREAFIGTMVFKTDLVLKFINDVLSYNLVVDYAINIFLGMRSNCQGFCLESNDFFYREHSETLSNTKKKDVTKQSLNLLNSIINVNPQFIKVIKNEIFWQSVLASRSESEFFYRMNWAFYALKVKPTYFYSYINLVKCIAILRFNKRPISSAFKTTTNYHN